MPEATDVQKPSTPPEQSAVNESQPGRMRLHIPWLANGGLQVEDTYYEVRNHVTEIADRHWPFLAHMHDTIRPAAEVETAKADSAEQLRAQITELEAKLGKLEATQDTGSTPGTPVAARK